MKSNTVEGYIELCEEGRKAAMQKLREMVFKHIPAVDESMQYKMPSYALNGEMLFAFASQKNYMSFYFFHYDLLEAMENITQKYDCGKSCVRFKYLYGSTLKDMEKLMVYVFNNMESSKFYGKYKAK